MLNIAVLAPMPTASVKMTTRVNTGVLQQHADGMPQIPNESVHVGQGNRAVLLPTVAASRSTVTGGNELRRRIAAIAADRAVR